jgi:hypothetical protein
MVYAKLVQISSFVQYMAYDTFPILIRRSEIPNVLDINGVIAAYDFPTVLKMSEDLASTYQSSGSDDLPTTRGSVWGSKPVTLYILTAGHVQIERLNELCGTVELGVCNVREVTAGKKLAIDTDKKNMYAILQHCAAHPLVTWVEERRELKVFNKYTSRIIQGQVGQGNASEKHPDVLAEWFDRQGRNRR